MFRLLIASFIAYILLPQNLEPSSFKAQNGETVTILAALTAADALMQDFSKICERNPDACETTISLLNNTKGMIVSVLSNAQVADENDVGTKIDTQSAESGSE